MKMIPLTQGKYAIVDDADYEWLSQWKWRVSSNKYVIRSGPRSEKPRRSYSMHRQIMNAPAGMDVDHINGNPLDNRRSNLRVCTHAENQCNQKLRSSSGNPYKGVRLNKSGTRWWARISKNGKEQHLGTFATAEEAAAAYDEAAKQLSGEFARTNR